VSDLKVNFGPYDPKGKAETELENLRMRDAMVNESRSTLWSSTDSLRTPNGEKPLSRIASTEDSPLVSRTKLPVMGNWIHSEPSADLYSPSTVVIVNAGQRSPERVTSPEVNPTRLLRRQTGLLLRPPTRSHRLRLPTDRSSTALANRQRKLRTYPINLEKMVN
jgi:hypothetical protein